jgi:hypothetical protein
MLVVSFIPRLPPAIDGVGDYALNLARQLRRDFSIETHFLVGDPSWTGNKEIEGFPISQVTVHSATTLLSLLATYDQQSVTILLHYVGYGYAKRGCPLWLVDGLQRWRTKDNNRVLVTMFHEVYASGPPWTSAFWLSPLQRNLAARLTQLSDRCLTSKQYHADILYKLSQGIQTQIPTLPVFSNIGEPQQVPPLVKRERRLVVFGGRSNRLRVYSQSLAELELACKLLEIKEIWDIGLSTGLTLSKVNGVPIVEMGQQSAPEISNILLNSLAGFFDYPTDFLAKSTIFAAYCAHGVLPISPQGHTMQVDGIVAGKHYWIPTQQTTSLKDVADVQAIADNAYSWYQSHHLSVQATIFASHLVSHL